MCEKSPDDTASERRKKIAISPRLIENDSYHEIREAVDIRWGHFLRQCGALPFVLPTCLDRADFASLEIDGILLTGGNDLDVLSPNPLSERRDAFETALLEYGMRNGIPVFGVCRGCQLIASRFGAALKEFDGHVATRHRLVRPLEGMEEVNSYHAWGVAELPDCLEELARTPDGSIEAFRHRELPISAVMWHPERETPTVPFDLQICQTSLNLQGFGR